MSDFMAGLTSDETVWAVQTIIRHASEFAACIYLGANLFHYFVHCAQDVDMDDLISTMFREALQSSMAYTLLYGMAHAYNYNPLEPMPKIPFVKTQQYISQVRSIYLDLGEQESDKRDPDRKHFKNLLDFFTRPDSASGRNLSSRRRGRRNRRGRAKLKK
jgi:hypothetical protein